jgi:hypothetical protein
MKDLPVAPDCFNPPRALENESLSRTECYPYGLSKAKNGSEYMPALFAGPRPHGTLAMCVTPDSPVWRMSTDESHPKNGSLFSAVCPTARNDE